MTVIAAVARDGHVVVAADTGCTCDGVVDRALPKIRRLGDDALIALSGTMHCIPRLRHLKVKPRKDLDRWAQDVAEKVTDLMFAGPPMLNNDKDQMECNLLLARHGRLWYIDTHVAYPVPDGYAVLGSGSEVAYGVLAAALGMGAAPEQAVTLAVQTACERRIDCNLVGGVMQIETLVA